MSEPANTGATVRTERVLPVAPGQIFSAFQHGDRLAKWWGPSGFTNTFHQFDFTPGGRWVLVMHGPNGVNYDNESFFRIIEPDSRIVIEHVSRPWFTLTVTLTPERNGTRVTWEQEFENAETTRRLLDIVGPANEQNLDRLQSVLASEIGSGAGSV